MSWMTKEGSSSVLGQSPLRFPLNELGRREVTTTRHDATDATSCVCIVDGRRLFGAAMEAATICSGGKAVGKPLGEGGVYRFEGFG